MWTPRSRLRDWVGKRSDRLLAITGHLAKQKALTDSACFERGFRASNTLWRSSLRLPRARACLGAALRGMQDPVCLHPGTALRLVMLLARPAHARQLLRQLLGANVVQDGDAGGEEDEETDGRAGEQDKVATRRWVSLSMIQAGGCAHLEMSCF